jgi:hypothetical protein
MLVGYAVRGMKWWLQRVERLLPQASDDSLHFCPAPTSTQLQPLPSSSLDRQTRYLLVKREEPWRC